MNRIGIVPDWAEDLLGIWAAADAGDARRRHGFGAASPMFRLWGVVDDDAEADGGYGSAEVAAMRVAVERLQVDEPAMYAAVLATFKPWTGIEATPATRALAMEAGAMLAQWVDAACGG